MTLMSSSICSLFLQLTPKASVMVLPILLSATAKVYSSSLSTMFLLRNLERDLGIFPFMSLLIDLKASAVLLNLWKSSRVTLNKLNELQFFQSVGIVEVLLEVFDFLEFLRFVAPEQSEACSCFEKNQHFSSDIYYYNFQYGLYLLIFHSYTSFLFLTIYFCIYIAILFKNR